MQPRDVGIMRRMAVAEQGLSEQMECNAYSLTAVIHILTHDSHAQECPSVRLVQSFECGWLVIMRRCIGRFWNIWQQQYSTEASVWQQQHVVVSPQSTDKIWGRLQSMGEITANRTAVIVTDARFRPSTTLSQGEGASTADDDDDGRHCVGA